MIKLNCDKIMRLRLATDMRVSTLAKKIGISPRMLSRMESEPDYNPGIKTICPLADYFNVRLEELIVRD